MTNSNFFDLVSQKFYVFTFYKKKVFSGLIYQGNLSYLGFGKLLGLPFLISPLPATVAATAEFSADTSGAGSRDNT